MDADRLEGMSQGLHKARSGLIRVLLRAVGGRISDIIISGDFILTPEHYIDRMEVALLGAEIDEDKVLEILKKFFNENKFQSPATYPEDFAIAIMKAAQENGRA